MSAPVSGVGESIRQADLERGAKRLVVFHLIPLGISLVILVKIVPVFAEIFQGFGAKLPSLLQWVIQLGQLARNYFFVGTLPACAAFLLLDVVLHRLLSNSLGKSAARAWFLGVGVLLLLLGVGLVAGCVVAVPFLFGPRP